MAAVGVQSVLPARDGDILEHCAIRAGVEMKRPRLRSARARAVVGNIRGHVGEIVEVVRNSQIFCAKPWRLHDERGPWNTFVPARIRAIVKHENAG